MSAHPKDMTIGEQRLWDETVARVSAAIIISPRSPLLSTGAVTSAAIEMADILVAERRKRTSK